MQALLKHQHGVIARWQAPGVGVALQVVDTRLHCGRWQPVYRGVYAAFTGPLPRLTVVWAALLRAGSGAMLSHYTAAELDGLTDECRPAVHVTLPESRRLRIVERAPQAPPIVVHYSARTAGHPARRPRRTRIEETTLDLTQLARTADDAMAWPIRACARGLTTPELLRAAMASRARLRWREPLTDAVSEAADGVGSLLESRHVRWVERPHKLPPATRQARSRVGQRTRYLDGLYKECGVAIELDGKAAHPAESRWRDTRRDNVTLVEGIITLRYGWADITDDPCRVAAQIAALLRRRGWKGRPAPCGPGCPVQPDPPPAPDQPTPP